ncbi:MAG: YifB family Mg chelatase-like AAA ATPase [Spirochaetaceae bacterium]|nr:YifB family Mg chelatase-like AAA ATPase [Spirochaetaceae bacterium]
MRALVFGHAPFGVDGDLVAVEVDLRRGIPGVDIVGLPDDAVRESRERVRVAIRNSGFQFPRDRVLVNLSPAGVRKVGAAYDLPLALAILVASGQVPAPRVPVVACGELNLAGAVHPVSGILTAVTAGAEAGHSWFLVPSGNRREAAALGVGTVMGVESLTDAVAAMAQAVAPAAARPDAGAAAHNAAAEGPSPWRRELGEITDIRGQSVLKRALAVTAAGGHHLLVFGPPGSGKTMAGHRLVGLLPPLPRHEALAVTQIHSVAGSLPVDAGLLRWPPFRAPHHSASPEGIVGGGRLLRPGEVSLAHHGVLMLDEGPEFSRPLLQCLREPLETGFVNVVRAGRTANFPSSFQLVMTANPCPCGNLGRRHAACICSTTEVKHYWKRLGGALLDRIDIRVPVSDAPPTELLGPGGEHPDDYLLAVRDARVRQQQRYRDCQWRLNARLPPREVDRYCELGEPEIRTLERGMRHARLSSRALHSVIKLSRTVADLDGCDRIAVAHVHEALQYRRYGDVDIYWHYD